MIQSKLPHVGTTIFSKVSALAGQYNAVNLGQGFPDFDVDSDLILAVNKAMIYGHNQYAPMPGIFPLRDEISKKIKKLYDVEFNPETEITITSGATEAIFSTIMALVKKGDEVIILEPAYDCYKPAIELAGGIPVPISLKTPSFEIPFGELEEKVSEKTRFIMVNTPHNPTGTLIDEKSWEKLTQFILDNDLIVLSDEVYEHIVFHGQKHIPVYKTEALKDRFVAFYSFGKTFHVTGWKVGYTVAPEHISNEIRKVHQFNVFSVNTAVQYGLTEFLKDEENYQTIDAMFERKLNILKNALQDSVFKALDCGGTYFMLIDYSAYANIADLDASTKLIKEVGVATIPLSPFISDESYDGKLLRICFAKSDSLLEQAGELLKKV